MWFPDSKLLPGEDDEGEKTMKINADDYRVKPEKKLRLAEWPTIGKPVCDSKKKYHSLLPDHVARLSDLQRLHYVSNRLLCTAVPNTQSAATASVFTYRRICILKLTPQAIVTAVRQGTLYYRDRILAPMSSSIAGLPAQIGKVAGAGCATQQ